MYLVDENETEKARTINLSEFHYSKGRLYIYHTRNIRHLLWTFSFLPYVPTLCCLKKTLFVTTITADNDDHHPSLLLIFLI